MRVLYILPYSLFPVNSGNKNLTYNLLKQAEFLYNCDILLLVDNNSDQDLIKEYFKTNLSRINNLFFYAYNFKSFNYFNIFKVFHPAFLKYYNSDVVKFLKNINYRFEYDIIHFDMIHTSFYKTYCKNIKSILVASDSYSLSARISFLSEKKVFIKLKLLVQYFLFRFYEKYIYKLFDSVCFVSQIDLSFASINNYNKNFRIIKIGVDDIFFVNSKIKFENQNFKGLLLAGSIDHHQNAFNFIEFINLLHEFNINIPITIIGKNIDNNLLKFISCYTSISYISYVENYVDFLNQDWIYVYPQKLGTGLQTKLQQAMAIGLPVIALKWSLSALELPKETCIAFECENYSQFIFHIRELSVNLNLRKNISFNSANFIRNKYSQNSIKLEIVDIYTNTFL